MPADGAAVQRNFSGSESEGKEYLLNMDGERGVMVEARCE